MKMKLSALVSTVLSTLLVLIGATLFTISAMAQSQKPEDDPKLATQSSPTDLEGVPVVKGGLPCETCLKNTAPGSFIDGQTPLIEPSGTAQKSQSGDTVR